MKLGYIFFVATALLVIGYIILNFVWQDIAAWYLGIPQPQYRVVIEKNVMVPSSDGVQLATCAWLAATKKSRFLKTIISAM